MSWDQAQPFLTALAIGLLLGFERERSHERGLPAGSRTFALVSLLGVLAASIASAVIVAGLVSVATLMAIAYFRSSRDDPGTTTEVAVIVAYLLGVLTWSEPGLAVALAVAVAALLVSKARLHHFVRDIVTDVELEDALKFFIVAFVVLPLLPDRDLGPYGVLNPSSVWRLVVLLTGIGWVGYIGVRALGPQRGLLVTGLAGGFVSASATTASMGRLSRAGGPIQPPLAGALLASLATFAQLLIVIGVVDGEVFSQLLPAVAAGAVVLAAVALVVYRRASTAPNPPGVDSPRPTRARPFTLTPALVLATVLTSALLLGRWGSEVLGRRGAMLAAGAAGLADAHAGAVSAASLAAKGDLSVSTAVLSCAAALGTNLLVKVVLAFGAGGRRFGLAFLAAIAAPTIIFGVTLALTHSVAG